MTFEWLYRPVDVVDQALAGGLHGAGIAVVLVLALLLGLRHALDPDHLVAVTSLVSGEGGGPRSASRLGASWGAGHAVVLLVVGLPLIAADAAMPPRLEQAAERAIGVVIMLLAARLLVRWWRARGSGSASFALPGSTGRSEWQAATIGIVDGLGGTGAVTVLFLSLLPDRSQAMLALAVFAPMTVVSMTVCTGGYAWAISRGAGGVARPGAVLMPLLGVFSASPSAAGSPACSDAPVPRAAPGPLTRRQTPPRPCGPASRRRVRSASCRPAPGRRRRGH